MKRKFVKLELFDPDDNGKRLSETIERTVADAFKFYMTQFPNALSKVGRFSGSISIDALWRVQEESQFNKNNTNQCDQVNKN